MVKAPVWLFGAQEVVKDRCLELRWLLKLHLFLCMARDSRQYMTVLSSSLFSMHTVMTHQARFGWPPPCRQEALFFACQGLTFSRVIADINSAFCQRKHAAGIKITIFGCYSVWCDLVPCGRLFWSFASHAAQDCNKKV